MEGSSENSAEMDSGNKNLFMSEDSDDQCETDEHTKHGTVIQHLLSQVKVEKQSLLGMQYNLSLYSATRVLQMKPGKDLTKISLPAYLLERRSYLEMYASFFSHPDLFVRIADMSSPQSRMMAVLAFYISTFSSSKESTIAKKPYNSVLGEMFRCFYEIPHSSEPTETVKDGPLPWARSNQLAFIGEQVSHHPPTSAFYAEHKEKRLQVNANITPTLKFWGLSIGVEIVGQASLKSLEHGEEYILSFPGGSVRSIFTTPWFELSDECLISCKESGYRARIRFHAKPFFGGKANRVSGEVFEPNSDEAFCTIDGEWNGQVFATYSSGRNECLFDVEKKKSRKFVERIENQEPNASRRLWEKVTRSLKSNDVKTAADEKRIIEENARQAAKQRLDSGLPHTPEYFRQDEHNSWIYKNQLTDRLASKKI